MKSIRIIALVSLLLLTFTSFSQSADTVEMADLLRRDGKIYTVVVGLTIILTAVIILLIRVDRKLDKLEKQGNKEK